MKRRIYRFVLSLFLFFLFPSCSMQFVPSKNFVTESAYLEYMKKELKIDRKEVYYIPKQFDDSIHIPVTRMSPFFFLKNKQIATFEEVTNQAVCPTNNLLDNGLNLNKIETDLAKSPEYSKFVFKNMESGEIIIPDKDEVVAVFLVSYKYGNLNFMRIKDRKKFASSLGIRTFVVSLDGYDIKSVTDIRKTEYVVKKSRFLFFSI